MLWSGKQKEPKKNSKAQYYLRMADYCNMNQHGFLNDRKGENKHE